MDIIVYRKDLVAHKEHVKPEEIKLDYLRRHTHVSVYTADRVIFLDENRKSYILKNRW